MKGTNQKEGQNIILFFNQLTIQRLRTTTTMEIGASPYLPYWNHHTDPSFSSRLVSSRLVARSCNDVFYLYVVLQWITAIDIGK